jgi:hypothetical protein
MQKAAQVLKQNPEMLHNRRSKGDPQASLETSQVGAYVFPLFLPQPPASDLSDNFDLFLEPSSGI